MFWLGIALVVLMGGVLAIFWNSLPPQLPWFYSLPWGEQQLVYKMWLVWILGGTVLFLFLTRIIAFWAGKNDKTVQTAVMMGGLMAVILEAASFIRIMMIFLNI